MCEYGKRRRMRVRLAVVFLLLCTAVTGLSLPISAADAPETNNDENREAQKIQTGILHYLENLYSFETTPVCADVFAEGAGGQADWFVLALYQAGLLQPGARYAGALLEMLSDGEIAAVTRQRAALSLLAAGAVGAEERAAAVLAETYGKQGIMSRIWGCILLQNGVNDKNVTQETALAELAALQLPDGGFALSGDRGEVDVTAMALMALAADGRTETTERALAFLSERQERDGGFCSYGKVNCESTAQVLLALVAVGEDPVSGIFGNLLGELLQWQCPDGGFCHTAGGKSDMMATAQVLCAAVAYTRGGRMWVLDDYVGARVVPVSPEPQSDENTTDGFTYFTLRCIMTALLALAIGFTTIFVGKREKKKGRSDLPLRLLILVFVVVLPLVWIANLPTGGAKKEIGTVLLTVRVWDTEEMDATVLASAGYDESGTLFSAEAPLYEGDSAYTVLERLCRERNVSLKADGIILGNTYSAYVTAVGELGERDFGAESGWQFTVNGNAPGESAGSVILQSGDRVEWLYVLHLQLP